MNYDADMYYNSSVNDSATTAVPKCQPPAILQFPVIFTDEQRRNGIIALHVIVSIYMVYGLYLVCDRYFVPSLKCVCNILKLQPDVAGATFMAIGTSAPELFTSLIGTTVTKNNIGLDTILGSAAFNLTFLIGVTALATGKAAQLSKWSVSRDSICYVVSVIAVYIVLSDHRVAWYEALILVLLYGMYIVVMYFNPKLSALVEKHSEDQTPDKPDEEEHTTLAAHKVDGYKSLDKVNGTTPSLEDNRSIQDTEKSNSVDEGPNKEDEDFMFDEIDSPLEVPEKWWQRILWVLCLPIGLVLFITIPDCRKQKWRRFFIITFITSIVWLSLLSYAMVWTFSVLGYTLHISDDVLSFAILGPATSIPDLVGSIVVAKDGYWDMAVSNSIGSNIFELLLCLGGTFFISAFLPPFAKNLTVIMKENSVMIISIQLLLALAITMVALIFSGWKLTRKVGFVLVFCYVSFLTFEILYKMGILGPEGLPICELRY